MINNVHRIGNFTSSQIFQLMSNGRGENGTGASFKTYIEKKNLERRLNRSIEADAYSQSMAWGTFLEQRVLNLLGFEYQLCSEQTDKHPTISCWAGSKDLIVEGLKISDIKCFQLENFALLTDCILSKDTERFKAEFPKEYWQLVSNAIISEVPMAEAISYCPYKSEIPEIAEMAYDYIEPDAWKYRFIYEKPETLPQLEDGGYYQNLNSFEFEVPKPDRDALTERVLLASKSLKPFYKPQLV